MFCVSVVVTKSLLHPKNIYIYFFQSENIFLHLGVGHFVVMYYAQFVLGLNIFNFWSFRLNNSWFQMFD